MWESTLLTEVNPLENLYELRDKISGCAKVSELGLKAARNQLTTAKILLQMDQSAVLDSQVADLEALEKSSQDFSRQMSKYKNQRDAVDELIEEIAKRDSGLERTKSNLPSLETSYLKSFKQKTIESEDQKPHHVFLEIEKALLELRQHRALNSDFTEESCVAYEEPYPCLMSPQTSVCSSMNTPLQLKSVKLHGLDPLTRRPIAVCVRNKKCGHLYDRDTILEFMRGSKGVKRKKRPGCPHFGCRNERMSEAQLEEEKSDQHESQLS